MRDELAGFTIGVTADRRRDELAALLERRGARVVLAPALRIVPLADDTDLREATRACLDQPPDVLMANTGIGMRGWLEAAEGWGLAEPLHAVLARAYVVARGPKARGAIRAAGLHDQWSPASESCEEVVEHLRRRGRGRAGGRHATARRPAAGVHRGAGGGRGHGDRGAGLPVGAADRPGAAAPADRPGRRPAGRRGHLHLRPGGRGAAAGRRGPHRDGAGGVARRRAGQLRRRGHRRAAGAARACRSARRAGPGSARWSAPSSTSCPAVPSR